MVEHAPTLPGATPAPVHRDGQEHIVKQVPLLRLRIILVRGANSFCSTYGSTPPYIPAGFRAISA